MDWELEIKDSGYLPEKGKLTEETVYFSSLKCKPLI